MPSLNFKSRFASQLESGAKRCTIRRPRKIPVRTGDTLHLFTGLRTPACRKLRVAVCRAVSPIEIRRNKAGRPQVRVKGRSLNSRQLRSLVLRDGHSTPLAFVDFFEETHGLPFSGDLIEW